MARRVVFKENVLSQSPNPSGPYRFVGYDGLTFSQLDNLGNITPIGGGNDAGGGGETVGASNGLSLSGSDIGLGGSISKNTTVDGAGWTFSMTNFGKLQFTASQAITVSDFTLNDGFRLRIYDPNSSQQNYLQSGVLTDISIVSIDADGTQSVVEAGVNGSSNYVWDGLSQSRIEIHTANQTIGVGDGSSNNRMVVTDEFSSKGLVYENDYSSNFTTYSLVTKGYVDAGTSSIFSTLSVSSYDYTEVNISSSQLLNIGTSPITLLAAPGTNKYYDFDKIIFEFTYGTITYNCPSKLFIVGYATPTIKIAYIDLSQLVSQTTNRICIVEPTKPDNYDIGGGILVNTHLSIELNEALLFTTIGLDDLTFGDGTMKVKIWYKVRNFG